MHRFGSLLPESEFHRTEGETMFKFRAFGKRCRLQLQGGRRNALQAVQAKIQYLLRHPPAELHQ
jgi:hypothetical protein